MRPNARVSSEANAKALNDALIAEAAVEPIVLIAHSKGTVIFELWPRGSGRHRKPASR